MTFKVVKISTSRTINPKIYQVQFNGDDRFFRAIEIHVERDFGPNTLDFIELYGVWCCLVHLELAGSNRTSRNLKLVVSRGAVKRLLLVSSSKEELYQYAYALRTQLFGLEDISVEKGEDWLQNEHAGICLKWDGLPPPQPAIDNPVFGRILMTFHSAVEYLAETKGECKRENVFARLSRIVKEADRESLLPDRANGHKERKYGSSQAGTRYLNNSAGWQIVVRPTEQNDALVALTVYQRHGF
ncbi:hypothetical protein [Pseudomonas sp. LS-2]|uniref:hypothetical protein n=1 Tax=Pseudomonas sp. LS-2 TaxID=2315859 RepID=UPI000E74CAF0|nr:hypothetical protein [Pseudomonas sp. LS-2]RJX72659.1 hypothetical protein D3M70_31150 [Pseudomonas sp. LS-2]